MLVEEIRVSQLEGLDRVFMDSYAQQAGMMTDSRQQSKVKHSFKDILGIVFFGVLAGNDEWEDIYDFAVDERETLKNYLELRNGIPSHDTLQRVFAIIRPEELQNISGVHCHSSPSGSSISTGCEYPKERTSFLPCFAAL